MFIVRHVFFMSHTREGGDFGQGVRDTYLCWSRDALIFIFVHQTLLWETLLEVDHPHVLDFYLWDSWSIQSKPRTHVSIIISIYMWSSCTATIAGSRRRNTEHMIQKEGPPRGPLLSLLCSSIPTSTSRTCAKLIWYILFAVYHRLLEGGWAAPR